MGKMTSQALAERYSDVRAFTMRLCEPLETEDYVVQSMTDASPVRWHIGHTTWFFEHFVLGASRGYEPFHPDYGFLFNSYYNAVGARTARPVRGMMTRPTVADVQRYRAHVDEAMSIRLADMSEDVEAIVEIGIHHEQQHQQLLLTDVKHLLSLNPLRPAYHEVEPVALAALPSMKWITLDEGVRRIGHEGDAFAYDHESPRHRVFLDTFEIADRLVTNREYLRFMQEGAYTRPELWLDDGWTHVQAEGWSSPLYWEERDGAWQIFTLGGMQPLALDEPVCHVSLFEADAFASWAGARLPTEAEWETAADGLRMSGNLADTGRFHPRAGDAGARGPLRQMIGDVWEWTQSQYRPYPGYRAAPGALGEYNGKFMCNQFVQRGGSCATHGTHIRPTYRNFFHPAARWQFAGIRLAR